MSNGRVIAGFCVGYGKQMFDAYGANMRERGRRCDEQLEIITRLWTEPSVTYAGKHYQIAELTCEPKPVQKPHPPIWWAGGEKSIPRAARHAQCLDLFLPTLEEIRTLGPKLRQACDRAGTSTELGTWVYAHVTEGETWSADDIDRHFAGYYFSNKPALPREVAVAGNPGQCVTKLREYQALGVTRFVLDFQNHGVDSVSSSLAQMERFARDVTPLL